MKKNVVLSLLVGSCLVSACVSQYPLNNNGIDKTEVKIIRNQGIVEVKVNKNTFPKKAFSTKAVDFSSAEIKKLKFNILPLGTGTCATELTTSVDWTAGTPINISLTNVPLGKALLSLHALDADGKILSSLHGMLEVVAGNNSAKISIFESTVAQVFMQWLSCTDENKALWQKVSISDVRNLIKAETGYEETTNKFTKINPTSLDITKIASNIQQNNGSIPATGTITNIEGSSSVNVNISEIGASITINDLTSTPVATTTSNAVSIPNVSFGKWLITVRKAGFQTYQAEFTADGIVNLSNIQLVPLVTPTPSPSITPVPTPTPSTTLPEVTIPTVPDGTIVIDGNSNDWNNVNPVASDSQGDNNGGVDLKAFYLAKDSKFLYWRMDNWNSATNTPQVTDHGYTVIISNSKNLMASDGDIESRIFSNKVDLMFDKIVNTQRTSLKQQYQVSGTYNNVSEMKIPLDAIGDMNNKIITPMYFNSVDNINPFKIVNFSVPVPPPSQYKIVFSSFRDNNREIYTMDGNGNNQTRLTNTPTEHERFPIFSPDGTKIVYNATSDTSLTPNFSHKLYVMNADGTNKKALGNFGNAGVLGEFTAQSWSPDGTKIVFHYDKEIYVYDLITDVKTKLSISNTDSFPIFSSDGKKIAFLSSRNSETALYVMNADGTNQRKLVNYQDTFASYPQWEPLPVLQPNEVFTGDLRLLYTSNDNIYKVTDEINPSSNNFAVTSKSNSNDNNTQPFWIGNNKILFAGRRILLDNSSSFSMYTTSIDGGTPQLFFTEPLMEKNISNDGKKLVFVKNANNPEIYSINIDGTSVTKLSNTTMDGEPDIH